MFTSGLTVKSLMHPLLFFKINSTLQYSCLENPMDGGAL